MERSALGVDMFQRDEMLQQRIATIESYIYRESIDLNDIRCSESVGTPEIESRFDVSEAKPSFNDKNWRKIKAGDAWGKKPDSLAWFRIPFTIPKEFAGKTLDIWIDVGGMGSGGFRSECLAYVDGKIKQGIDRNHFHLRLCEKATAGKKHLLAVEAFTGVHLTNHSFVAVKLMVVDPATQDLYYDAKVAYDGMKRMDENSRERARLEDVLNETFHLIDMSFADVPLSEGEIYGNPYKFIIPNFDNHYTTSDAFYESVEKAGRYLKREFYSKHKSPTADEKVVMVGHAHIDVAWLWRLAHSRKKCGRTFSTVLELMDRYPDFNFFQSQPLLYQYTKENYPELYKRIKDRVKDKRREATGAAGGEMDTNVPSGESLVRQFLFGKRFLKEEFGYDSRVMWLPDVFGYSWALPQIMKKSGVDYFMTTKISWNTYNEIPFDVFNWRGVDGTEILTSFITTGVEEYYFYTYNGPLEPETVQTAWTNYKGKNRTDEVMMSFGYGDGGGGPAEEQMETAKRLKNFPGLPDSRMGRVDEFFERLDTQEGRTHVWNGELYFELHRGTYTTQAETKWFNRKCEIALHNAELLASQAWLQGKAYPHKTINDSWRRVLTNQFHDILPGSSIKMVYDDTRRDYTESLNEAEAVQEKALSTLLKAYKTDEIVVFNTLSWSRNDVAHLPKLSGSLWDGEDACPTQTVKDINGKSETLAYVSDIPSHGQKSLRLDKSKKSLKSELKVSETSLENRFYKISLDANGEIRSLKDKRAKREVLEKGARGNQLQIFEDLPLQNDAWDIDIFYVDKMQPVKALDSIKVIETGPVRAGVEITRSFGRSKLRQRMFIYADIARIDFETDVDWQESKRMLKVAFPVDIHSDFASYEIQFGAIRRPTHWNTSWDWAKFEVCAQRWADLSEGDYGVSLLNESKYGYDIKDNILRHTLLRSPSAPDRRADLGRQVFTYSLYPHQDDWARAETVQRAAELNVPLISGTGSGKAANSQSSFVSIDKEHVIIDTVKKAEDRDELVVRLYESANRRGKITLSFDRPVKKAFSLNMMEEIEGPLKVSGNKITLDITPYEVVTIGVKV